MFVSQRQYIQDRETDIINKRKTIKYEMKKATYE